MLVALPTSAEGGETAPIEPHFGRTAGFTLFDTETAETDFVDHTGSRGPTGTPPPATVSNTDAAVLIAGHIGRGAVSRLRAADIDVYRGAEGTVADALAQWDDGALEEVWPEDVHGHGHDHEHSHGHGHEHDHGDGDCNGDCQD